MDRTSRFTQDFTSNFSPFAAKVGTNLSQFKRMAYERMGVATDITPLPEEYLLLEHKVAHFKALIIELLKLWKLTVSEDRYLDYQAFQGQVSDAKSNITDRLWISRKSRHSSISETSTRARVNSNSGIPFSANTITEKDLIPSIYNKISSACLDTAIDIGLEQPQGNILFKFGSIEENVGQFKNIMDQTIYNESWPKLSSFLSTQLASIQETCTLVQNSRLALDTIKSQQKPQSTQVEAPPSTEGAKGTEEPQQHLETTPQSPNLPNNSPISEEIPEICDEHAQFYSSVNEAIKKMRAFLNSNALFEVILVYTKQQQQFFQESSSILDDLLPEIENAKVSHDKLYLPLVNNLIMEHQLDSDSAQITTSASALDSVPLSPSPTVSTSATILAPSQPLNSETRRNQFSNRNKATDSYAFDTESHSIDLNMPEIKHQSRNPSQNHVATKDSQVQHIDKFLELDDAQSIDLNSDKEYDFEQDGELGDNQEQEANILSYQLDNKVISSTADRNSNMTLNHGSGKEKDQNQKKDQDENQDQMEKLEKNRGQIQKQTKDSAAKKDEQNDSGIDQNPNKSTNDNKNGESKNNQNKSTEDQTPTTLEDSSQEFFESSNLEVNLDTSSKMALQSSPVEN